MINKKFYTCCFTGHRPNKISYIYDEKSIKFLFLKFKLKRTIKHFIKKGYIYFISGMALGIDIMCAELVLKLKKKYFKIQLECAIPCKNQTNRWGDKNIEKYNKILSLADKVTYTSNCDYFNGCMQKRNKYMIDNSTLLIAVFSGANGGTKQTIGYAKSKKIKIKILKV